MTLNFCTVEILYSNSSSFLDQLETEPLDGEENEMSDSKSPKSQSHSPFRKEPLHGGLGESSGKVLYLKTKILHIPKLIVANSAILPCETIYNLAQWKIYYYSIEIKFLIRCT